MNSGGGANVDTRDNVSEKEGMRIGAVNHFEAVTSTGE